MPWLCIWWDMIQDPGNAVPLAARYGSVAPVPLRHSYGRLTRTPAQIVRGTPRSIDPA